MNVTDFGSLILPIPSAPQKLTLADLIASKDDICRYLPTVDILDYNKDDMQEQPSATGMALVADYYNKKQDQHCNIYIASRMQDLQYIARKIATGVDNQKAVVIFQPTDNLNETREWFYAMHKTVVYLENSNGVMHIFCSDSTPYENVKKLCRLLIDLVLPDNMPRVHYIPESLNLDAAKGSRLHIQTDFWNCGTHAFKIARIIATDVAFLDKLEIIYSATRTPETITVTLNTFKLPVAFAKLVDNQVAYNVCETKFGTEFTPLANGHFQKYPVGFAYINKFTEKYRSIIEDYFNSLSPAELFAIISSNDAGKYQGTPAPNLLRTTSVCASFF